MTKAQPRYRQLAALLRQKISSGALQPGDQLPTEFELCEAHKISRHTAREALRLLSEDGLIARKRGIGTVVTDVKSPAFAQSISDFDSLLQYARDAKLSLETAALAEDATLDQLGLTGAYTVFTGKRASAAAEAIAVTRIHVRAEYAPSLETANGISGALTEWVEATHGVSIAAVTQRIEAVALSMADAKWLGAKVDQPALRTIRRYRDANENIIILSESVHPAGRFAYEIRLTRTGK